MYFCLLTESVFFELTLSFPLLASIMLICKEPCNGSLYWSQQSVNSYGKCLMSVCAYHLVTRKSNNELVDYHKHVVFIIWFWGMWWYQCLSSRGRSIRGCHSCGNLVINHFIWHLKRMKRHAQLSHTRPLACCPYYNVECYCCNGCGVTGLSISQ